MLLASLLSSFQAQGSSDRQMIAASEVLQALSDSDPSSIALHLERAVAAGAAPAQIGTLALFANRKAVSVVLRTAFGCRVEDYRTLGSEPGLDAHPDYPLLAALAYAHESRLQKRALAWGADPAATWSVKKVMGRYHGREPPHVISWLSSALVSRSPSLVKQLLGALRKTGAWPLAHEEQDRCLFALHEAMVGLRNGPTPDIGSLSELVSWLGPDGPYALERTFWDVATERVSLAIQVTCLNASAHRSDLSLLFEAWIRRTAPSKGVSHQQVLHHVIGESERRLCLPVWCVESISPSQAQEILASVWERGIRGALDRAATTVHVIFDHHATLSLNTALGDYEGVLRRAREAPMANARLASPAQLLGGALAARPTRAIYLSSALLNHVVDRWSSETGLSVPPQDACLLAEFERLQPALEKFTTGPSQASLSPEQRIEKKHLLAHLDALTERFILCATVDPPRSTPATTSPRL